MGLYERAWRWFEHFVIIPFRWFRIHVRNWRELRQRCKVCGNADHFNFNVPDDIWATVVPEKFRNRVVCLACFDRFAKEKGVAYATALQDLYFAGDKASFIFAVKSAADVEDA